MVSDRRRLLYITPVCPAPTGNGLAMRAHAVLDVLADAYAVSVLVVPLYWSSASRLDERLRSKCEELRSVPPAPAPGCIAAAAEAYAGCRFDVAHVFRLSAAPFARPYFSSSSRPEAHLDLDDIESRTRHRIAELHRENGETEAAGVEQAAARRAELLEAAAFRSFQRIYVCSETDRRHVEPRARAETRVLPNSVVPPASVTPAPRGAVSRLLFVGTLGYYPNQDALRWFCSKILPLIRSGAHNEVVLDIVGSGDSRPIAHLAADGVRLGGPVPDVQPYYERAHCVVVPVRAGGGTRIKILESFSYRRPVVTTTIGMEGIEALAGEDLLCGDSPGEFAQHCLAILTDSLLANRLAANALTLLRSSYSREMLQRVLTCPP
jgi:glycosyltransferase involved in cell wall biosynthesis